MMMTLSHFCIMSLFLDLSLHAPSNIQLNIKSMCGGGNGRGGGRQINPS